MNNNKVTQETIDRLYEEAEKYTNVVFDKCIILSVKLKNGFVITESSACVDPKNFDFNKGKEICEACIKNKLWELQGYLLQNSQKKNME